MKQGDGYRYDLRLPRELSIKVESLRKGLAKSMGRRVTKSEVLRYIIEQFLKRVSD